MSKPKEKFWLGMRFNHVACGKEGHIIRLFFDSEHFMSIEGICEYCAVEFSIELDLTKVHKACAQKEAEINKEYDNLIDFPIPGDGKPN